MAVKKGSKAIHLSSEVIKAVEQQMEAEEWRWGMTSFVERRLLGGDVSTEKLFLILFGLGIIDEKKLQEVRAMIKGGTLPKKVPGDKFGIKIQPKG